MVRLEEIVPGSRVRGIASRDFVEILAARSFGPDAVEVTYKGNGTVDQTVLYRSSEVELELASPTRRFAFDGDGHLLRLASEALRIRLAHLFDPFVAVRSSQIEALPHQLTAVYGEMLPRQPLRFLLADDPGAGKTIMAGLFIKELLIRGDLERCLIVAPGSLVEQWQDELSEKFGLLFDILTRDQVEAAATGNFFAEHQRVIARLDMLARAEDLRKRLQAAPTWDLIICDEAHRMSASFFGGEVKYTKRYQLGQTLGSVARHLLLMSATPHNGKEEDFQLFMGLLDSDRFEGRFREGAHKVDVSDMMRRLTKEELRRFDGTPLFPERKAYTVSYKLSAQEAALYEGVTRYVRDEMNRADQIQDGGERRRNTVGFALQILQRRLASSPAAIHESLKRRLARLEARLEEESFSNAGDPLPRRYPKQSRCRHGMKMTLKKLPRTRLRAWRMRLSIRRPQPAPSQNSKPKSHRLRSSRAWRERCAVPGKWHPPLLPDSRARATRNCAPIPRKTPCASSAARHIAWPNVRLSAQTTAQSRRPG